MSGVLTSLSPERRAVADVIRDADAPITAPEIAEAVTSSVGSVRQMLPPLTEMGLIQKVSRGLYWRPDAHRQDAQAENQRDPPRMGLAMEQRRSVTDFLGSPEARNPYDDLARAGRAIVAEARDASGQIVYAVRVEFLVRLTPEQLGMTYGVEEVTAETA